MNGTITVATRAMRLMPPSITTPTIRAMAQPKSRRYTRTLSSPSQPPRAVAKPLVSIASGVVKVVIRASVNWLAFIMHRVPKRPATAKKRASGVHFLPRPCSIMCIGPPWGAPVSSRPLYIMASTPSWYFVAMPTSALTHIQNIAPGPPMTSAMATPAMLPNPTVAATTEARAWADDICPVVSPPSFLWRSSRNAAGRRRTDTAPELMKR